MIASHKDSFIEDVLDEAAYRLKAALWMIEEQTQGNRNPDAPDCGGYDFAIAREAIEDVIRELREASESEQVITTRPALDLDKLREALTKPPFVEHEGA